MKKMLGVKRVLTVALYSTDLALFPGSPRARTRSGKERGELVSCPPPPPPPPRAPPGEKRSGERSQISWAYSPKR